MLLRRGLEAREAAREMGGSGSAAGGRWARPTLTRPILAITHNINGYVREEIGDSKKTVRYEHLFGAAKRADVTLIGWQEHHARPRHPAT